MQQNVFIPFLLILSTLTGCDPNEITRSGTQQEQKTFTDGNNKTKTYFDTIHKFEKVNTFNELSKSTSEYINDWDRNQGVDIQVSLRVKVPLDAESGMLLLDEACSKSTLVFKKKLSLDHTLKLLSSHPIDFSHLIDGEVKNYHISTHSTCAIDEFKFAYIRDNFKHFMANVKALMDETVISAIFYAPSIRSHSLYQAPKANFKFIQIQISQKENKMGLFLYRAQDHTSNLHVMLSTPNTYTQLFYEDILSLVLKDLFIM